MHNRNRARLAGVDPRHVLDRFEDFGSRAPDRVVETAHPDYTRRHGEAILARADCLPLSVTALADDALREQPDRRGTRERPQSDAAGVVKPFDFV